MGKLLPDRSSAFKHLFLKMVKKRNRFCWDPPTTFLERVISEATSEPRTMYFFLIWVSFPEGVRSETPPMGCRSVFKVFRHAHRTSNINPAHQNRSSKLQEQTATMCSRYGTSTTVSLRYSSTMFINYEGGYLRISLRGGVIFYFLGQVREPAGKLLKIEYVVDQR
mgnify:CR=1 FL=1